MEVHSRTERGSAVLLNALTNSGKHVRPVIAYYLNRLKVERLDSHSLSMLLDVVSTDSDPASGKQNLHWSWRVADVYELLMNLRDQPPQVVHALIEAASDRLSTRRQMAVRLLGSARSSQAHVKDVLLLALDDDDLTTRSSAAASLLQLGAGTNKVYDRLGSVDI